MKQTAKLSVVHVIDELPPDGAERLIVDLMRSRSGDIDYSVLCLVRGGVLEQELRDIGIKVEILGKRSGFDPSLIPRLVRWFKQRQPDVVHTHLFTADFWARSAAWLAGVPKVFSTSHSENNWKTPTHRFLDRRMAGVSDKVIACTAQVSTVLCERDRIPSSRIAVIANGIDLQRFSNAKAVQLKQEFNIPDADCHIALVGRYHPVKGHLYFLQVFAELQKVLANNGQRAHLLYVGEGELRPEIEAQIEHAELTDCVSLTGFRDDVPSLMQSIDIVVVPSELEGLPMVVLEAMSQGKVVVAHDVGGISDVISDDSLGRIVPAGDSAAFTSALAEVAGSQQLRDEIGVAAKALVLQRYDARQTLAAYEALYLDSLPNAAT